MRGNTIALKRFLISCLGCYRVKGAQPWYWLHPRQSDAYRERSAPGVACFERLSLLRLIPKLAKMAKHRYLHDADDLVGFRTGDGLANCRAAVPPIQHVQQSRPIYRPRRDTS